MVLGFLARLIGLGDIATPVRNVMTRVRGVIDSAIDRVVGWIAGIARRIGGALRRGANQVVGGARAVVGAGAARVRGWLGLRQRFSGADGSTHTIYWERSGPSGVLTMASTPAPVERVLQLIRPRVAGDPQLLARWTAAEAQRVMVNGLKARVASAGPTARQPADVDALNDAMRVLSDRMRDLEPVISPTSAPAGGAMPAWVVPGALARIKSSGQIATIVDVERHESGMPMARYVITDPRNPQSAAVQRGQSNTAGTPAVSGNHAARLWEQVESRIARLFYMGATPDKSSPVGAAVEARMRAELLPDGLGKIVGSQVRSMRDANDNPLPTSAPPRLVQLADCDMGHVVDAVHWWNTNGRFTGARSAEVRSFMTDPANYEFEPRDINQLRGRRQAASGIRYLPSMKIT